MKLFLVALVTTFALAWADEVPVDGMMTTTAAYPKVTFCLSCKAPVTDQKSKSLPKSCTSEPCPMSGKYAAFCYYEWKKMRFDKRSAKAIPHNVTTGGCLTDAVAKTVKTLVKFDVNTNRTCFRNATEVLCVCQGNNCNLNTANSIQQSAVGLLFTALVLALFNRS